MLFYLVLQFLWFRNIIDVPFLYSHNNLVVHNDQSLLFLINFQLSIMNQSSNVFASISNPVRRNIVKFLLLTKFKIIINISARPKYIRSFSITSQMSRARRRYFKMLLVVVALIALITVLVATNKNKDEASASSLTISTEAPAPSPILKLHQPH